MAFTLPDLPYAHDALAAGGMSRETLEYHHDKHHKAYVDKLNELIAGTEWEGKSLEDTAALFGGGDPNSRRSSRANSNLGDAKLSDVRKRKSNQSNESTSSRPV